MDLRFADPHDFADKSYPVDIAIMLQGEMKIMTIDQ